MISSKSHFSLISLELLISCIIFSLMSMNLLSLCENLTISLVSFLD